MAAQIFGVELEISSYFCFIYYVVSFNRKLL